MPNLLASRATVARTDGLTPRSALKIGDLFTLPNSRSGRVYMHTGARTNPPSAGANSGKTVGYQSIIVDGKAKDGSDGAAVSFDLGQRVKLVGKAELHGKFFA